MQLCVYRTGDKLFTGVEKPGDKLFTADKLSPVLLLLVIMPCPGFSLVHDTGNYFIAGNDDTNDD